MIKAFAEQTKKILVANKKRIAGAIVFVAILGALAAGAHAMYTVSGVVTAVGNNTVTVSNFFRTQTVDLTGSPVTAANIKVGEKIKIQKNLQGNVLYARSSQEKSDHHEDGKKHR